MQFNIDTNYEIKGLNDIVAEDLQHQLRMKLSHFNLINREFESDFPNQGAYIQHMNGNRFVNIKYGFTANSLTELLAGAEIFINDFVESVKGLNGFISFRQPISITQENNKYYLTMRCATIKKKDLKCQ